MSVDFDAIARSGRCDVSSLRLALPLLEQGYTPPFLARYRTDELSGVDEATLWALNRALKSEQQLDRRREELKSAWEKTSLRDPAIGHAIKKANTARVLSRIANRLKSESIDSVSDATRLANRILSPQKGDGNDIAQIASSVDGITDATAAVAGLDEAITRRMLGDPRVIATATRWLAKNARIHIESISDPHGSTSEHSGGKQSGGKTPTDANQNKQTQAKAAAEQAKQPSAVGGESDATSKPNPNESDQPEANAAGADKPTEVADPAPPATTTSAADSPDDASSETPSSAAVGDTAPTQPVTEAAKTPAAEAAKSPAAESAENPVAEPAKNPVAEPAKTAATSVQKPAAKTEEPTPKKSKKVSPRQRRRRWLVSVLKPLAGKRFKSDKLSAFQIVMLGRALRSQVARCAFEYDAAKLVAELQKSVAGFNRPMEAKLRELVIQHEADIREAAESAWWDDLSERASARLITVTSNHLRRHVNRGPVEAKVVMSIDAVGPRTAAAAIVTADGRLLHSEDIPCQLSAAQRSQAVTKMGELIHNHHVDLIVISNGPARRAMMIALGDLIKASPEKSIHWTLADRSGADAYSGSTIANQEMRSTPRRFRAAAWLAFSILQPAQAITKVDPLKLRLSSFQRELSDDAVLGALEDVLISGTSRGGVDVNSAPASWLARLPGMTASVAEAIDAERRQSLFATREAVAELDQWESTSQNRQAIPFLRVFGSEEVLDGTLVHPEDYALARKLAKSLEIELPPNAPPGYSPPVFDAEPEPHGPAKLTEVESPSEPIPVENFGSADREAADFEVDQAESASDATDQTSSAEAVDAATAKPTNDEASAEAETLKPASTDAQDETESVAETEPATDSNPEPSTAEAKDSSEPETKSETATNEPTAEQPADAETPAAPAAPEIHLTVKQPLPDKAKIDKCVKEWQIGANRANQIVHWLCDPFGDSDVSGTPPAVLSYMPATKELKPGDPVVGVVVSVMPFGVFVELAPDCSGLIHVSRISESFIEDLHEAVQVGDVLTAWVVGIDEKRRRVALSAISPERARALEEQRHARSDRGRFHDNRQGRGGPRGGQGGGDRSRANKEGAAKGAAGAAGRSGGGGRGKPQGKANEGRRDRGRQGGRGQGGRDRGRGGRGRERKPESFRIESKEEVKPITDEMQQGKEPMRTFGDLAQFFDTPAEPDKPKQESAPEKSAPEKSTEQARPSETATESPVVESATESASDDATANSGSEAKPATPEASETESKVAPASPEPTAKTPESESPSPDSTATDA